MIRTLCCWALALFFAFAGVMHFVAVEAFAAIVPPGLPYPETIVRVTGAMELVFAAGLVWPRWRARTGWALALFLLCVLPANIHMAVAEMPLGKIKTDKTLLWVRVALQFPFIAFILWATRSFGTRKLGTLRDCRS